MVGTLTLVGLAVSAVSVEGSSTCPRPEEVAAELARILPPSSAADASSALIEQTPTGIRIELRDPSGATVGARVIEGSTRCADLATAGAVVIATWVSAMAQAPPMVEETAPPPAPKPPTPKAAPLTLEIAVGALGSYSNGFGLGAEVLASVTPAEGHWGGQLSLAALGSHQVSLGVGVATWQRFAFGLGGHRRFRPGSWRVDVEAQGVAALLAISGDDNTREVSRTGFDPGLSLGLRAVSEPGLWVGTFAIAWLKPEEVSGLALTPVPKLPQFEVFLAAGVAWSSD